MSKRSAQTPASQGVAGALDGRPMVTGSVAHLDEEARMVFEQNTPQENLAINRLKYPGRANSAMLPYFGDFMEDF